MKLWFEAEWFLLLSGVVKDNILFSQNPSSLTDFERLIVEAIGTIDQKILKKAFLSMKHGVKVCCANTGGLVEHLL